VDENALQTVFARDAKQSVEVLLMGVNAAIRDQAEEMKLAPALLCTLHGAHDGSVLLKFVSSNQSVDAGDVHLHDAAGADVQVANFAVAHLSIRQSDKMLRGADQRIGVFAKQLVVGWLAG
jgi:hypothetical protein